MNQLKYKNPDMTPSTTILFNVSPEDLQNMIKNSVREELSKLNSENNSQPTSPGVEQPITQAEAIEFLQKSRQTINEWRRKGLIKGHKLGGRIYFYKSQLVQFMK